MSPRDHMTPAHYRTTDPYLAAFIVSQGATLAGCRRLTPKKVEYRFVADRRLHWLLQLYWSDQPVLLTPSLLFTALRHLKKRSLTRR
jgi:hypothetical protein